MQNQAPDQSARDPSKKTRRAVRPCDSCRRKKTRCVLVEDPNSKRCTVCQERGVDCKFELKPPPRKLGAKSTAIPRPAGSEHAQSGLLASSDRSVSVQSESSPRNMDLAAFTQNQNDFLSFPFLQGTAIPQGFSSARSPSQDAPGPTYTNRSLVTNSNLLASVLPDSTHRDKSLGLATGRFSELYGLTSDMEPILMRHRPYDSENREYKLASHSIRRVEKHDGSLEYPVTFHIVSDEKAIGYQPDFSEEDEIESCVRPHGPKLVSLFWRIVHPSYPILYRDGFMGDYSKSYRQIPAALLGAVYLIALNWWTYDRELSNTPPPDAGLLRKNAIQAVQNAYHRPKLSSIEAILLLLQCKPEDPLNPDHTWTWGCTGQALAIGEALGLHLDASNWDIPKWEKDLRKRLSWALFMQDKWTALVHGRPSHIHEEDWAVDAISYLDLGVLDDITDENEASTDMQTGSIVFIKLIELTRVVDEILKKFFSLRASRRQDTVGLYEEAVPILARLRSWYINLPPSLSMELHTLGRLCSNGYLHLSYYSIAISLLRRLIRSTALAPVCLDVVVLHQTRQLAHQIAASAIDFVSSLRADQLEAFWYFNSPFAYSLIGSFSTLLLCTSRTETEKAHWRDYLNRYLWHLRIMGKASEPMKYAVNRLEGAILKGMEHALVLDEEDPPPSLPITNYEDMFGTGDIMAMDLEAFDWLNEMQV